ncbi:hypothetical protein [Trichothermofontia sp.]
MTRDPQRDSYGKRPSPEPKRQPDPQAQGPADGNMPPDVRLPKRVHDPLRSRTPSPSPFTPILPGTVPPGYGQPTSAIDADPWSSSPSTPIEQPPGAGSGSPHQPLWQWAKAQLTSGRWQPGWRFWVTASLLTTGGLTILALAMLLKLPAAPNCPRIFWPTASASLRLYCAQLAASKQTAKDLLEAIELVNSLPQDHPLRTEINQNIRQWSLDLLKVAEDTFQMGNLSEAIAIAEQVPAEVPDPEDETQTLGDVAQHQIQRWRQIWSDAEAIYAEAEAELRKENWRAAFRVATGLLSVGNTYWETVKYDELNQTIQAAREDGEKLAEARSLAEAGGLDNLLKAIKLAQTLSSDSFYYQEAQAELKNFGNQMLDLAQSALDRQDLDQALDIARKVPAAAQLEPEKQDFILIAQAHAEAWLGNTTGLERAIAQVQKLRPDRPYYSKAQTLISRWQREIQDVIRLERAERYAQSGLIPDLNAAIAELREIPSDHPRWEQAQTQIQKWTREAQTIQDRPYLDRAEQLARSGQVADLQAAINEASQIRPGRSLYDEAQARIWEWTTAIQRIEDEPILAQARALANQGDLPNAIAIAQQIESQRTLYDEAQSDIQHWQATVDARRNLQSAYQQASAATPASLAAAIRTADRVTAGSGLRANADQAIQQWSYQMLAIADNRSGYDLAGAITIARQIPAGTPAYGEAQARIEHWQSLLTPPPMPELPPVPPSAPVSPPTPASGVTVPARTN